MGVINGVVTKFTVIYWDIILNFLPMPGNKPWITLQHGKPDALKCLLDQDTSCPKGFDNVQSKAIPK
jgi:hypothetical protein